MAKNKGLTKKTFIEICKQCQTIKEVAGKLGVSVRMVYKYADKFDLKLSELGLTKPAIEHSSELRKLICTTYMQVHSAKAVYRTLRKKFGEHRLGEKRILQILKDIGFNILPGVETTHVLNHFNGNYNVPIPNKMLELIEGQLLGDAHIRSESDSLGIKWNRSLSEYHTALNMPQYLIKSLSSNIIKLDEAVEKYNNAVRIISQVMTAKLVFHTSLLAEPWIRFLSKRFQQYGYSTTIPPPTDTIQMVTQSTVQLYFVCLRWSLFGIKRLASNIRITSKSLLNLYVGDGYVDQEYLILCTESFNEIENHSLANILETTLGIDTQVFSYVSRTTSELLYRIRIGGSDIRVFLNYLEDAPSDALELSKQLYPWKFDPALRKKDVYHPKTKFVREDYLQTFLDLLEQAGVNISNRTQQLNQLFPWKFPIPSSF